MAHPLLPDPGELAAKMAAERVSQAWVGKSAKARARERDRVAAALLPLCAAVVKGLAPVAEKLAGLDGDGGRGDTIRRLYEEDQARRAEVEARYVRVREGRAG